MPGPDKYVKPPKPPKDQSKNGGVGSPDIINIIQVITETPVRRGGIRWGDNIKKTQENN